MIPEEVTIWLQTNGFGAITRTQAVGGGCINNGTHLTTASGKTFFLKTNRHSPGDMFAREAEGLKALRVVDGPRVPDAYCFGDDFLLLEDLAPAPRRPDYWATFGRQLADLHKHTHDLFGFDQDNFIGSTPQPNPWLEDGYRFFGEHRLLYQASLARDRGLLGKADFSKVERLCSCLPELVPVQEASLIHGDLWSGNAITDENGHPALIDPAAHYGWAEAELAMTTLFGAFSDVFYETYVEMRPLERGYRQRFPIYNLYHLLNHLNLFGGGYLGQVQAILQSYMK